MSNTDCFATQKERGMYGSKLTPGQSQSEKYPGYIDCGNGTYRKPSVWFNKKQNRERSSNHYFIEAACAHCQKVSLQWRANSQKHRNSFCSKECKKSFLQARSAGNRIVKKREHGNGHHVQIRTHGHPRSGRHNLVYEHVLVAEKKLGRFIKKTERVHHINCIKNDNRPENLFVCTNDVEHFKIHGSLNQCVAELMKLGVLFFDEKTKTYMVRK